MTCFLILKIVSLPTPQTAINKATFIKVILPPCILLCWASQQSITVSSYKFLGFLSTWHWCRLMLLASLYLPFFFSGHSMYSYKLEKPGQLKTLYSHLYQKVRLKYIINISFFQMMLKYYELGRLEELKLSSFFWVLFEVTGRVPRFDKMLFTYFSTVSEKVSYAICSKYFFMWQLTLRLFVLLHCKGDMSALHGVWFLFRKWVGMEILFWSKGQEVFCSVNLVNLIPGQWYLKCCCEGRYPENGLQLLALLEKRKNNTCKFSK